LSRPLVRLIQRGRSRSNLPKVSSATAKSDAEMGVGHEPGFIEVIAQP